jgi:hypothetical protein
MVCIVWYSDSSLNVWLSASLCLEIYPDLASFTLLSVDVEVPTFYDSTYFMYIIQIKVSVCIPIFIGYYFWVSYFILTF